MPTSPLISVIVPVYNAESTLARCVDSLLGQTFTDFEVLLIDDGSRDASPALCDAYPARDPRVRVFHKDNGGVSSARNVGLGNARGEWIAFVDSDDWVGTCYLESFTRHLDADLIVGSAVKVGAESGELCLQDRVGWYPSVESAISGYLFHVLMTVPWGKLFRRDTVDVLRFNQKMKIGEDTCFVVSFLSACESLRILSYEKKSESEYFYDSPPCIEAKYQISVESAVYHLKTLNQAYERLGISDNDFDIYMPQSFYEYCVNDLPKNGSIWYRDKEIRRICLRRSRRKGWKSYLLTWLAFAGFYRIKVLKLKRNKK